MRRVSQLEAFSLPLISPHRHSRRPQHVCAACRKAIAPASPSLFASLHTSAVKAAPEGGNIPLLERVRRRVMGGGDRASASAGSESGETVSSTDEAAEAESKSSVGESGSDPSSKPKTASKKASRQPAAPKRDPTYEPARTWDGLEEVGEIVDPREHTRVPGQVFHSFMSLRQMTDSTELTQALQDSIEFASKSNNASPESKEKKGSSWLSTTFESDSHKFIVVKRFMQLSGVRIPDQIIDSTRTAQGLLNHIIAPPKPKKLVESLLANDVLLELPNVQVFERRVTPIDKETRLGRWKVVEKELQARGLPITGHS